MGEFSELFREANEALFASIRSIVDDGSMSLVAKQAAVAETIGQYKEYAGPMVVKFAKAVGDVVATVNHRPDTIATPVRPAATFSPADLVALAMRVNNLDVPPDQLATLGDGGMFYDELMRRAEEFRLPEESQAQAFVRACATSDGKALLDAHRKLARPSVAKSAHNVAVVTLAKGDAYASLEAKAEELRKSDPKLRVLSDWGCWGQAIPLASSHSRESLASLRGRRVAAA